MSHKERKTNLKHAEEANEETAREPQNIGKEANKKPTQQYDNTLKALFGDEAKVIVPYLLTGMRVLDEVNVEIDRSKLKADLVYRILEGRKRMLLNLELQTAPDPELMARLIQYAGGLFAQHKLPVATAVIFPFKMQVPRTPFQFKSGKKVHLSLDYEPICLWKLDAAPVVKHHIISLYSLLPAMKGARAALLKHALEEMAQQYTRQQLGPHLIRFAAIMRRATVMSEADKQEIEEVLKVQYAYDEFIDKNPDVMQRIAKAAEASELKGEIRAQQNAILNVLNLRYPALEVQAQDAVRRVQDLSRLDTIFKQLILCENEQDVQRLLNNHLNDA